jgi:hypothetical protein
MGDIAFAAEERFPSDLLRRRADGCGLSCRGRRGTTDGRLQPAA